MCHSSGLLSSGVVDANDPPWEDSSGEAGEAGLTNGDPASVGVGGRISINRNRPLRTVVRNIDVPAVSALSHEASLKRQCVPLEFGCHARRDQVLEAEGKRRLPAEDCAGLVDIPDVARPL